MNLDYQRSLIEQFFTDIPGVTQSTCHATAAQILGMEGTPVADDAIKPVPMQGSLSYTCVALTPYSSNNTENSIIQFRKAEIALDTTAAAHTVYGGIVPLVRSHGKYHGLFVYSAPLLEGEPYVASLMSPEGEPPLFHRLQTTRDLAPIFSRLSCAGTKPLSLSHNHHHQPHHHHQQLRSMRR